MQNQSEKSEGNNESNINEENDASNNNLEVKQSSTTLNTGIISNLEKNNNVNNSNSHSGINSGFNTGSGNGNVLPNIENFFVLNEKVLLVDSEKSLWHLTKCKKYEEFTAKNNYASKEENFNAFLEYYQNLSKNKNNEKSVDVSVEKDPNKRYSCNLEGEKSTTNYYESARNNHEKDTSFNLSDSN